LLFRGLLSGLSQISDVDGSSGVAANFPPVRGDLMILSAIAERLKRRSKEDFKDWHFEAPLILQAKAAHTAPFARGCDTAANQAQRGLTERREGDRLIRFSSSPST
jgi:hypothetical protein